MCGIAGFFNTTLPLERYPDTIQSMLAMISHRGPDESGYYMAPRIAMGTVRLSIIDLGSGQQPIGDIQGRYWICFNGEIYNYKELREELVAQGCPFQTQSDTEVLLHAWITWGQEAWKRLNGAFACAIYDSHTQRLILARDRYGKRPLFYTRHQNGILFASEMKAFLAYNGFQFCLDVNQLATIFTIWTPLPNQTGFKDISQLPMGSTAMLIGEELTIHAYASLNFNPGAFDGSETDGIDLVRQTLEESVRLRLRSDVEVGTYLSGGLDSAIVTHLAQKRTSEQVQSFSIAFDESEFDESDDQKELVRYLGTTHTCLSVSNQDIVEHFPAAVWHAEVPLFRTALVPMYLLSRQVQERGLKVVLTGEGADEAFLGYNIFKETLLRLEWHHLNDATRKERLTSLYPYLRHFNASNLKPLIGMYNRYADETIPGLFSHEMRFQNTFLALRLLQDVPPAIAGLTAMLEDEADIYFRLSSIQKAQWLEYKTLLAGYLLSSQGDRMCLAHGVENRCPFMDPAVIQAASILNLRFDDGWREKYLLRCAFSDQLPPRILNKKKQPYRAPDLMAFLAHPPEYMEQLLSEAELGRLDFLDQCFCRTFIRKIFATPSDRISPRENLAFINLLSVALLHRMFVDRTYKQPYRPPPLVRRVDRRWEGEAPMIPNG